MKTENVEAIDKSDHWEAINKGLAYAEAQAERLIFAGDHETAAPIVTYLAESRIALNELCEVKL